MLVVKLLIIRAKAYGQNLDLGIFSSEEALSLHFSFKLGSKPGSLVILNVSLMRAHLGTYPAEFYYSNSRPHKYRMRNYVSTSAENGLAMAGTSRTSSGAYATARVCIATPTGNILEASEMRIPL